MNNFAAPGCMMALQKAAASGGGKSSSASWMSGVIPTLLISMPAGVWYLRRKLAEFLSTVTVLSQPYAQ